MTAAVLVTFPDPDFDEKIVEIEDDFEEYYNETFPAGCEVPFVDYVAKQLTSPVDCDFDWQKMCSDRSCELCNAVENWLNRNAGWREYYERQKASCDLPLFLMNGCTYERSWHSPSALEMCGNAWCDYCGQLEKKMKQVAYSAKRVEREEEGTAVSRAKRSRRNELALLLG